VFNGLNPDFDPQPASAPSANVAVLADRRTAAASAGKVLRRENCFAAANFTRVK
jgi:hypothetical protein